MLELIVLSMCEIHRLTLEISYNDDDDNDKDDNDMMMIMIW